MRDDRERAFSAITAPRAYDAHPRTRSNKILRDIDVIRGARKVILKNRNLSDENHRCVRGIRTQTNVDFTRM